MFLLGTSIVVSTNPSYGGCCNCCKTIDEGEGCNVCCTIHVPPWIKAHSCCVTLSDDSTPREKRKSFPMSLLATQILWSKATPNQDLSCKFTMPHILLNRVTNLVMLDNVGFFLLFWRGFKLIFWSHNVMGIEMELVGWPKKKKREKG